MTNLTPPRSKPRTQTLAKLGIGVTEDDNDTARYIVDPESIWRPTLTVPGGLSFVFPIGVEGFEVTESAVIGLHKYLSSNQVDADVTHRAETRVTLSGTFPGWTAVANMNALRQVFYAATSERGKILDMPGIFSNMQYVVCDSLNFSHAQDERARDITYNAAFLKIGTGEKSTAPSPASSVNAKGKGWKVFSSNAKFNTLRKIGNQIKVPWAELYAVPSTAKWFDSRSIAAYKAPDYRLPPGTQIHY